MKQKQISGKPVVGDEFCLSHFTETRLDELWSAEQGMTDLLKRHAAGKETQIGNETALSFLSAVLDLSSDIIAFLDSNKRPILFGKNTANGDASLRNAEMCAVSDQAGNLVGYILREKRWKSEDRDYLTGTVGRARLAEEFSRRTQPQNRQRELTLLFIDLDRFKPVNEQYGHLVGDQVLLQFSTLLKNTFRCGDCVARYGGDEFVILCDCPAEVARSRVEEFRQRLLSHYIEVSYPEPDTENEQIVLGFSYGVTLVRQEDTLETALRRADLELFRMKKAGDNPPL